MTTKDLTKEQKRMEVAARLADVIMSNGFKSVRDLDETVDNLIKGRVSGVVTPSTNEKVLTHTAVINALIQAEYEIRNTTMFLTEGCIPKETALSILDSIAADLGVPFETL